MNYALYENKKVSAEEYKKSENLDLRCPCCNSQVVAKQGEINVWHFAHKVKNKCSEWFKPMTEWHLNWQKQFPEKNREVIHKCEKTGEKHIADVKTDNGIVIEFQHSSISSKEIKSREEFYGKKMIWVLDGSSFKCEIKSGKKINKSGLEVINRNKHLLKHKAEFISKKLNCNEHEYLDVLELKINEYISYTNSYKILSRNKIFQLCNNPIIIDNNDNYLYLIKYKKNEKLLKFQDNTTIEYMFNNSYIETIGSIKISKQKFLEKYAQ